MELKELLEKGFDAGYNTSVAYNCGSCEGAFDSFEDWYESIKSLLPKVNRSLPKWKPKTFVDWLGANYTKDRNTYTNKNNGSKWTIEQLSEIYLYQ